MKIVFRETDFFYKISFFVKLTFWRLFNIFLNLISVRGNFRRFRRFRKIDILAIFLTFFSIWFQFVETLEDWLVSLETHPQGPTKEVLIEYRSKVDFLKKVLESRIEKENKAQPQLYKKVDVVDVAGKNFSKILFLIFF